METETQTPMQRAVTLAGSQSALADICGTRQSTISHAVKNRPGAVLARKIHDALDGAVPCWELRPDVFKPPFQVKP